MAEDANTKLQEELLKALEGQQSLQTQVNSLTSFNKHLRALVGNEQATSHEGIHARLLDAEQQIQQLREQNHKLEGVRNELSSQLQETQIAAERHQPPSNFWGGGCGGWYHFSCYRGEDEN
ncbi:hypothetical protein DUNSADRAFT_7370 [Dunaliella salina]|uniref:Uncharacterized protein n=1 Tax=Dunaliella salina TaxID=3046 RepID=A0ABQ7H6C9_DUNSA|nr:hypothetical protein DUNSADRAFT_7370 [Dunaliella salina]|eukprot:KAF5842386.1 hypothetical protein DUNSADRAFT_7370 [Dunaliella salina]